MSNCQHGMLAKLETCADPSTKRVQSPYRQYSRGRYHKAHGNARRINLFSFWGLRFPIDSLWPFASWSLTTKEKDIVTGNTSNIKGKVVCSGRLSKEWFNNAFTSSQGDFQISGVWELYTVEIWEEVKLVDSWNQCLHKGFAIPSSEEWMTKYQTIVWHG